MTQNKSLRKKAYQSLKVVAYPSLSCVFCKVKGKSYPITDTERGEIYCGSCGTVLKQKIEYEGWDNAEFGMEYYKANAGLGPLQSQAHGNSVSSLATTIDVQNKDYAGKSIPHPFLNTIRSLRFWNTRTIQKSKTRKESKRDDVYQRLITLKEKLGLSDSTVESAMSIYKKIVLKGVAHRKPVGVILGSIIYAACRQSNTPRTMEEIYPHTGASKKRIMRCYREILDVTSMKIPSHDAKSSVSKISSSLGISERMQRKALAILDCEAVKSYSVGKSPSPIAAASIYLACLITGGRISQRKIRDASGVSHVTIVKHVKKINSITEKKL